MKKLDISRNNYKFLHKNLKIYKDRKIINDTQYNEILNLYNIRKVNSIQIITILGSLLIFLGILVYVSSKWKSIDNIGKLIIIISTYLGANLISYLTHNNHKKTSKSMLYLGMLIYGAGIMLTQDMFNHRVSFLPSGMLWIIGILPMVYVFEDKLAYLFSMIIYFGFSFSYMQTYTTMVWLTYLALYVIGRQLFKNYIVGTIINRIILLSIIPQYLFTLDLEHIYIFIIMICIGIFLNIYKFRENKEMYSIMGIILIGIFGIYLTEVEYWKVIFSQGVSTMASYAVGILYFVYFIYKIPKVSFLSVIFIISLIVRYFSDSLMLVVPKSIMFIVIGIILIASGFYIENKIQRKVNKK